MAVCRLSDVIAPPFGEVHRAIKTGRVQEAVCKGGRGSCKSSYFSVELALQLLRRPDCHAAVLRKVGGTLRASVYTQVCWDIAQLGLARQFKCTVAPMERTYLPAGQKILFFGLDDPGKLKSIKVPFGYIGVAWFEELDQFAGPEEIRNVEQSLFRGGSFSLSLKSFNPPAMARNWANRYVLEARPGKLVHHSTYLTAPERWLGTRFLDDTEPKSIGDYKSFGLLCRGAEKGPGSVEYSHKWLQSLAAIVIAPARCPDTYREFSEYEYERDPDGAVLPG